jgi:hypothetical protein
MLYVVSEYLEMTMPRPQSPYSGFVLTLHMSAAAAALRVRFGLQPALQPWYGIVCREYSADAVFPAEVPPVLLLGGHFAEYASDEDAASDVAAAGSGESDAEVAHEEPVDHMPSPAPCSDAESVASDDVEADFLDFDEADELKYVVEKEAHMHA